MKILLINPPTRTWSAPNCFPQGLGYIAQALRADHDLQILDLNIIRPPNLYTDTLAEYVDTDIDAIGITGIITNYKAVRDLTVNLNYLFPNVPVVVGGALGSSIPEILLRKTGTDIVCIGEGEVTAVELFRQLEERNFSPYDVSGLAVFNGEEVGYTAPRNPIKNISQLPLPAYDLFDTEAYARNPVGSTINVRKWEDGGIIEDEDSVTFNFTGEIVNSMNILSSRGCPYSCTFCYHDFMGQGYRFRSAESLMNEITFLYSNYNVGFILMGDDCFIVNRKNVREFCDLLEVTKYRERIFWECGARVDGVTRTLLERMKAVGCTLVGYGIESGSQQILDALNKKVTVRQCHEAVEMTQEIFGDCEATFIIGSPGETRQTIQETIDFCKQHNLAPHSIFYLTPYPATPLWAWMKGKGWFGTTKEEILASEEKLCLELSDNEQGENLVWNFTLFSDSELISLKERMVAELDAWNKIKH